jgi:hypothetical protein
VRIARNAALLTENSFFTPDVFAYVPSVRFRRNTAGSIGGNPKKPAGDPAYVMALLGERVAYVRCIRRHTCSTDLNVADPDQEMASGFAGRNRGGESIIPARY